MGYQSIQRTVSLVATTLLLLAVGGGATATADIRVVNLDGPHEGFNDATPVASVGGNEGVTLGAQRLKALQFAADIWGARLTSDVEIHVGAEFNPLPCNAVSAVLGSAGPNSVIRDFLNAPTANTWFVQALANSLVGADADPGEDDIGAEFNGRIGAPGCLTGNGWYFGVDGNPPPGQLDFVTIALHELGHGLGFLELMNLKTGAKFLGFDDAFMRFLENPETGKLYPEMLDHERAEANTADNLQWAGADATDDGDGLVRGRDTLTGQIAMYAPEHIEFGSSVAHFSDKVSPDELMEPFYSGPTHNVELTVALFSDIGWPVSENIICGNGALDPGEMCDDGNVVGGDGCEQMCRVEACFQCRGEPSSCVLDPSCGFTLDHFQCYQSQIAQGSPLFSPRSATLTDGEETTTVKIVKPTNLCAPARVNNGETFDKTAHLTCYQLKGAPRQAAEQQVRVANQFSGDQRLDVAQLQSLCVPSMADHTPSSLKLAPYACYAAQASQESRRPESHKVEIVDRFNAVSTTIVQPVNFCTPLAATTQEDASNPEASLTCYQEKKTLGVGNAGSHKTLIANQLGSEQSLEVSTPNVLCAPSRKLALE